MIGNLKKLKDNAGNYILPVTSSSAVITTDGMMIEDKFIIESDTAPVGTVTGRLWLDTTENGTTGTAVGAMEDLLNSSIYKLNIDSNGIYTEIDFKRKDGTLVSKSVLSGGTSPEYTTRTITDYELDGTTVRSTKVYTLTYTNGEVTSEVLN